MRPSRTFDLHLANARPPAGRRESEKRSRVRTADERVERDEVAAGDDVEQLIAQVGDAAAHRCDDRAKAGRARYGIGHTISPLSALVFGCGGRLPAHCGHAG
jgi:hypothetical protein